MAIPQSATILHHLRQTVLRRDGAGMSDGQLLRSFLYHGEESAFEALVRRHGPMVRGVCRRVLRNVHDADDAFQAAFLVLVRKASTLAAREVLGDWLHGVAYRTALKARTAAARRRWKEQQAFRHETIVDEPDRSDWLPLLDQEISRLPPKYRQPVVLCDLEGRTRKDAAEHLGWPEGTLSGRLSRARAMLARRLIRRGLTLSTATLTTGLAGEASARVPFSLVGSTCKAAMGSVPGHVAALTEGVVKAMCVAKLKKSAAIMMAAFVLAAGAGAWRYAAAGSNEERVGEYPAPLAPKADAVPAPNQDKFAAPAPLPRAGRAFQIDVKIVERTDGQEKNLAELHGRTLEGQPLSATRAEGDSPMIDLGGGKSVEVMLGPTIRTIVRSGRQGKMRLDLLVSKPAKATLGDAVFLETKSLRWIVDVTLGDQIQARYSMSKLPQTVLEMTANVQEVQEVVETNTIAAAEKDLKTAESHRRAGRYDSARTGYERISRRYPDTIYAERAKERLAELKKRKEKPPARVGQIFLRGNKKISDDVILKAANLFHGQILTLADLDLADRKLSQLKGLKGAQVSVIEREGEGTFKDIEITVEEK